MIVLIDNGHGRDTAGKRSPDGRLREYAYTREIAKRLQAALGSVEGVTEAYLITPEEKDIALATRCKRANMYCRKYGAANVLLVSLHNNAAGADGQWHDARGWSAHVAPNASARSKALAACLADAAAANGQRVRKYTQAQPYIVQNLAICRDTLCPAVLTENLFQDNRADVDILLSEQGKQTVVNIHADGIRAYIKKIKQ